MPRCDVRTIARESLAGELYDAKVLDFGSSCATRESFLIPILFDFRGQTSTETACQTLRTVRDGSLESLRGTTFGDSIRRENLARRYGGNGPNPLRPGNSNVLHRDTMMEAHQY